MEITGFPVERKFGNLVFVNEVLEPAISCCITTRAKQRVRPEQEAELHASAFNQLRCVRCYFHAVTRRIEAGRHSTCASPGSDFHHAKTTGAVRHESLVVAKGGDIHTGFLCGLENKRPAFDTNFNTVDGQSNHRTLLTRKIVNQAKAAMFQQSGTRVLHTWVIL
jgi:hypothetical protein